MKHRQSLVHRAPSGSMHGPVTLDEWRMQHSCSASQVIPHGEMDATFVIAVSTEVACAPLQHASEESAHSVACLHTALWQCFSVKSARERNRTHLSDFLHLIHREAAREGSLVPEAFICVLGLLCKVLVLLFREPPVVRQQLCIPGHANTLLSPLCAIHAPHIS